MDSDQCFAEVDAALHGDLADDPYAERAMLVSLLANHYPAWRFRDASGETCFQNIVCIQLPLGQACWHVHDKDMIRFLEHLPYLEQGDVPYDGHTTAQKYRRILASRRT